ncbi:hypothetical protein [Mammaliicoccus sciuri]|uniref:hypothetical protein n=1 Tax=Mammaliicoccus sciuri TaxID=1296 RepID=UPI001628F235|nr:hypothetical protein [Mammaliicoccus sciuri]
MKYEDIIQSIELHKKDLNFENGQLIIELKCNPSSKKGKSLLKGLNSMIDNQYTLVYGNTEFLLLKWECFVKGANIIENIINRYFENYIHMTMIPNHNHNIDINTNTVEINKAHNIYLYTETINSIRSKKLNYIEELHLTENDELLNAVNNIKNCLANYMQPSDNDIITLKKFARYTSNISGFASDIITILSIFLK